MRFVTLGYLILVSVVSQSSIRASEPATESKPQDELARIAHFFEHSTEAEPAVLRRILKDDREGTPTPGGVIVDGSLVNVYHTLEKTPKGLRIQISAVHD